MRRAALAIVVALGVRALYLSISYWISAQGPPRYTIESAWVLFVIAVAVARWIRYGNDGDEGAIREALPIPLWTLALFGAVAAALFWPSLSIGLLSDDFVLVDRSSRWNLGAYNAEAFRPLPLLVWALLLRIGGGAVALHAVNLALHALNGFLTSRVVAPWVPGRAWALAAGLLLVTSSASPEAVVWSTGVFDLLVATLMLACVIVSRGYGPDPPLGRRALFMALGLAALLSKEIAAIVGALVLLDAWAARKLSRLLIFDTVALTVIAGLYGAVRIAGSPRAAQPVTKYMLQRTVLGAFEGVAAPWHLDVAGRMPWIPVCGTIAVFAALVMFFLRAPTATRTRVASAWAVAVPLSVVPVLTLFVVAPDLQGSRYLYVPSIAWAALFVSAAAPERRDDRLTTPLGVCALIVWIAVSAVAARRHLVPWQAAAALRDRIERAARDDSRFAACSSVALENLPDNVSGAFVFRNGVAEAFASDLGMHAIVGRGENGCTFRWTDDGFIRQP